MIVAPTLGNLLRRGLSDADNSNQNSEPIMTATLLNSPSHAETLARPLAAAHDRWMAECDVALGPVTDRDATFLQRWAAMRYVAETFLERFQLEQELLEELRPFLLPEVRERLRRQVDRLARLQQNLERLTRQRGTGREITHSARELLEALRLWYAEIEFAVGDLPRHALSNAASRLLDQFSRPAWLHERFVS